MRLSIRLLGAAVFGALMQAAVAHADPAYFTDEAGVALDGYDPVAYFTDGAPAMGSAEFQAAWDGVTWQFASAAHRDAFVADPAAYAPQYGGFCAFAAANNAVAETDPVDAWTVRDGKLYLNFDSSIRSLWSQDIPGHLAKSEANWPGLKTRIESDSVPITRK
jgi:YHS domain-containing protein